jgi:hypothetical protein
MTCRIHHTALPLLIVLVMRIFLPASDAHSSMNINITEAKNGSITNIVVGTNLNVFLKVPSQEIFRDSCLWSKVTASGDAALQEVRKYVLLPTGVTAAFFRAIQPGVVQLRSSRYDCSNGLMIEWRVDVRVTS